MKMGQFEWCDAYCINIEKVDTLQKRLLELMQQLNEIREQKSDNKHIVDVLNGMTELARHFFRMEEKMLTRFKYPEYQSHRREHRDFIKKLITFRRWFTEDSAELTDEMFIFFDLWIKKHIMDSDRRYAPFIRLQQFLDKNERRLIVKNTNIA